MGRILIYFEKGSNATAAQIQSTLRKNGLVVKAVDVERPLNKAQQANHRLMIQKADFVVILLASGLYQSQRARHYLRLAQQYKKTIIPILVEPVPSSEPRASGRYLDGTQSITQAITRLLAIIQKRTSKRVTFPVKKPLWNQVAPMAILLPILILVIFFVLIVAENALSASDTTIIPTLYRLPTSNAASAMTTTNEGEIVAAVATLEPSPVSQQAVSSPIDNSNEPTQTPLSEENLALTAELEPQSTPDEETTSAEPTAIPTVAIPVVSVNNAAVNTSGNTAPRIYPTSTPEPIVPTEIPFRVDFRVNTERGSAPLSITFFNASTGNIVAYQWDFDGDGQIDTTDANPQPVTYANPGSFLAKLTATHADGRTAWQVIRIKVDPASQSQTNRLNSAFSVDIERGEAPLTVTFTNRSSGEIAGYEWDFDGDDVIDATDASPPPYTYKEPGIYFASLAVTGSDGKEHASLSMIVVDEAITQVVNAPVGSIFLNLSIPTPTYVWQSLYPTATPRTILATSTSTPLPTRTAPPTITPTSQPNPPLEVVDSSESVPIVESTQDVVPSATPTATITPTPTLTATWTLAPSATWTPFPTATHTLAPSATWTPFPTATWTLVPSATWTLVPSATWTPIPTATWTPIPPTPLPAPTSTPTG